MTDPNPPESPRSGLLAGMLEGLLELASIGCLAPILALYASLIVLAALDVFAVVVAVRQQ